MIHIHWHVEYQNDRASAKLIRDMRDYIERRYPEAVVEAHVVWNLDVEPSWLVRNGERFEVSGKEDYGHPILDDLVREEFRLTDKFAWPGQVSI